MKTPHDNEIQFCAQCDKAFPYWEIEGTLCKDCTQEVEDLASDLKNKALGPIDTVEAITNLCPDALEYLKQIAEV